ncbi:Putative ATPase subunit of terminase (gpP-like) [Geobacillus sp. 12AMOR1]|nr:Putative ATPase subunit of terminase (gpP-like) [Geobacillus sp. 12AMOR1]
MMPNHKDEIEKLSTAMKEAKSKRAYERYQAIYLHLQGYTKGEIATIIGRSKKTIYNYICKLAHYFRIPFSNYFRRIRK